MFNKKRYDEWGDEIELKVRSKMFRKKEKKISMEEVNRNNFESIRIRCERIEAEIDKLKFPMGEVLLPARPDGTWMVSLFGGKPRAEYKFANKVYEIPDISAWDITGYRKMGDYVEIQWKITIPDKKQTKMKRHTSFLIDGTLKPMPDVEVKFDCGFVEVIQSSR